MLKYYVIDNDIEQMLVCISKQGLISRTSVAIPNRRLAIAGVCVCVCVCVCVDWFLRV